MSDEQNCYKLLEMKARHSRCKSLEMNASETTSEMPITKHTCLKIRPRITSVLSIYIWLSYLGNYCLEASTNCTATVCKLRYELASELHTLRNYRTCADAFQQDCICNRTIDVLFIEHPPYIYTDAKSKKVVGLLPGILRDALKVCCFDCTKLRFLPPYKTTTEAIMMFPSSTVVMPWVTSSNALTVAGDIFIAAMPTKGVAYVTSLEMSMIHFQRFAASISSNWPLFCISLILAVDAGIIVWLLDSWRNKEQFPSDFLHGISEGLWWAYVSMTTVGYGDKTPKSILARAFGILWITVGVSLSGIFTASLITGMTQSLNDGALSLEGKNVGILNSTRYELTIGMREGANIKEYRTYRELIAALSSGAVEGFLLDELVMKHYWSELNRDIKNIYVRMNTIKNTATSYGILFSASEDNVINKEWGKFLQNFFSDNRDNLAVIVKKAEKNLPKKLAERITVESNHGQNSIFNSPEIYKLLFKYIGIGTLILIVLGFAFEKGRIWLKTKLARRKERSSVRIGSASHKSNGHLGSTHEDNIVLVLQKKFENVMKEIGENGNYDVRDIRKKVLKQVFNYEDNTVNMNGSFVNEFQLEELRSNNGDCVHTKQ